VDGRAVRLDSAMDAMPPETASKMWAAAASAGVLTMEECEAGAPGVRLNEGALLHHHDELARCVVEVAPCAGTAP
jgi:hypothetical protein